jgi:ABC-type Co2+ transport system permease subunit
MACTSYNIPGSPTEVLFKHGLLSETSPTLSEDRKKLFYTRCIPIRLLIVLFVFSLSYITNKNIQSFLSVTVMIISAYIIFKLSGRSSEQLQCAWWSNNIEILQAVTAFAISFISIYNGVSCMTGIAVVLLFNVIAGLAQSSIKKPFS